jgi:DNA adenine methylase
MSDTSLFDDIGRIEFSAYCIRYAGGKSRLKGSLAHAIHQFYDRHAGDFEYREPFLGSGSVAREVLENNHRHSSAHQIKRIWLNDKDPAMSCLWDCVINRPEALKQQAAKYKPTVEDFFKWKGELRDLDHLPGVNDRLDVAIKKMGLHQMSFSGLGTMGSVLGGHHQSGEMRVGSRWSVKKIHREIETYRRLFGNIEVTHGTCTALDFEPLIADPRPAFLLLDPPYYVQGPKLYQFAFTHEDHVRLARALKRTKHPWLMTYDICDEIVTLYEWADMEKILVPYSMGKKGVKEELLICPFKHSYLIDEYNAHQSSVRP